ncbi:MAG: stage II sporulation protein M [Oscillospiraceae bacterium]|jgi:stage II sporulation protein M|nr:stage II sporulation protein M [Oscillospiraceae bacterium]
MKQTLLKWARPEARSWPALIVLSALFLCGAVAGCLVAFRADEAAAETMREFLRGPLLAQDEPGTGILLGRALYNAFKYHVAVFLLGFTMLGVGLIPLVAAVRGFFLSFAVAAFVQAFGPGGLWLAAGAFGAQALLTLPCLFLVSLRGIAASAALLSAATGPSRRPPAPGRFGAACFLPFALCSVVLCLSALFETFLTPHLLRFIAGYFLPL